MKKFILFFFTFTLLLSSSPALIYAEECDNPSSLNEAAVVRCSEQLEKILGQYSSANNYNRQQLFGWQNQIKGLQNRIKELEAGIFERQVKMGVKQTLLSAKIKQDYIRKRGQSLFLILFSSDSAANFFRDLIYRERLARDDKELITSIAEETKTLKDLTEKINSQKGELSRQAERLAGEIKKAQSYITILESKKAALDARQQQLLAEKLAGLNIPRSAYSLQGGCVDDRNIDPGFSPRIAFFTFGVPNRVGMNQYGAKGRAEAGQNAQQILSAYYDADYTTGYNTSINIRVVGSNEYGQSFDNTWNIDEYLKHLYEVSGDWPMETLKAQAIAARSYALAYTNNGQGSICPSQKCQVVKKEINNGTWQAAVDQTRGIVLIKGGQPAKAWFSSTHGGYVFKSGEIGWNDTSWTKHAIDTNNGSAGSFSDLFNNAYDKNSPWFYCDWGYRKDYNKTAWLKPEEVADIANVILLARKDSSTRDHLYQVDKPSSQEIWDAGRVKQELRNRGGTPIDSVSDIGIGTDWGGGRTTTVTIAGNTFDGSEFKDFFNLRAPANIQIVGPLFNVERK